MKNRIKVWIVKQLTKDVELSVVNLFQRKLDRNNVRRDEIINKIKSKEFNNHFYNVVNHDSEITSVKNIPKDTYWNKIRKIIYSCILFMVCNKSYWKIKQYYKTQKLVGDKINKIDDIVNNYYNNTTYEERVNRSIQLGVRRKEDVDIENVDIENRMRLMQSLRINRIQNERKDE